jgi:hypothetical protein
MTAHQGEEKLLPDYENADIMETAVITSSIKELMCHYA